MLTEDKRKQLDGIIQRMQSNKEPEKNIQMVVSDFKKKYSGDENRTKNEFDAVLKGFRNVGKSIKEAGEGVADIQEKPISNIGKVAGTFGKFMKPFSQIAAETVATPLRVGGEVVERATGYDINTTTSNAIQKLVSKGMSTDVAQNTLKKYNELKKTNPEAANALASAMDIGEFVTIPLGVDKGAGVVDEGVTAGLKTAKRTTGSAAEQIAKGAVKTAESTKPFTDTVANITKKYTKNIGEQTGKTDVPLDEAISNIKSRLQKQIEGKVSTKKKMDKKQTDILNTISQNPKYHPNIDVDNRVFNVDNAVNNMQQDISNIGNGLSELFKKADNIDRGVKTKSIIESVEKNLLKKENMPKIIIAGGAKGSFANEMRKIFDNMQKVYGDVVPRNAVWEIRRQIDNSISTIADTNVKKALRSDVRKAFANSLEDSLPNMGDTNIVKNAMSEMQKIIEAKDYSENALKGFKIKGGSLTDLIRNAVSSDIGRATGAGIGGALGSIPGAVVGFGVSSKIGDWLAKNALSSVADRKALESFIQKDSQVLNNINKYIEKLSGKEKAQAEKNIKLLER